LLLGRYVAGRRNASNQKSFCFCWLRAFVNKNCSLRYQLLVRP
jgi:hypothetical protein